MTVITPSSAYGYVSTFDEDVDLATATKHISETICCIIGEFKCLLGRVYLNTRIARLLTIDPGRDNQVPLWSFFIGILISCCVSIIGGGGGGIIQVLYYQMIGQVYVIILFLGFIYP